MVVLSIRNGIYKVHIYGTYILYIYKVFYTLCVNHNNVLPTNWGAFRILPNNQVGAFSGCGVQLNAFECFCKKNPSQGPESTSGGSRVKCSSAKKQMCSFQNKVISYFRLFYKLYNWLIIHISTHRKHDSHWSSKKFQQF